MRIRHILIFLLLIAVSCSNKVENPQPAGRCPSMFPDYLGTTVPATIAPLNFEVEGDEWIDVTLTGDDGKTLHTNGPYADFPIKKWHNLLESNAGSSITVKVFGLKGNRWIEYDSFRFFVSTDPIDFGITYRLTYPSYQVFGKLGIYERDLSCFDAHELFGVDEINGCINCHSFNACNPDDMSIHVRGDNGATIIRQNRKMVALNTKTDSTISSFVYTYWHPSGNYIAYSNNLSRQGFFQNMEHVLDAFDISSDIVVYDIRKNEIISTPLLKGDNAWETFPAFSPDGHKLFFCCASPKKIPDEVQEIRYNLCSIDFDPESASFGNKIDTLVLAEADGLSISFPKPSFDGRYLMYTAASYGSFSIWHNDADLWLLDLKTMEMRRIDRASSASSAESHHNWSSTSRWFVFGTRRDDNTTTHAYICHIDENGETGIPFLLPQKNPRHYYDSELRSFNLPEFVTKPVEFDNHKVYKLLKRPARKQVNYRKED